MLRVAQDRLRRGLRRLGLDVHRYPTGDGLARAVDLMNRSDLDLVVDVGASVGEYVHELRSRGYRGDVLSFEPLSESFRALSRRASRDQRWTARQSALGAEVGEIDINVAANRGESSSALPMLDRHVNAAPEAQIVAVEKCGLSTLDAALETEDRYAERDFFLKLDVQGLEGAVLEGARKSAANGRIRGLQIELSLAPLYEGAMPGKAAFDWAESNGLKPVYVRPGFSDQRHELLQFDAFFFHF